MSKSPYGINLKNIVDDFKKLSNKHKQLNSFGFGDVDEFTYQVDSRDKQNNPDFQSPYYPYFYVVPSNVIQEFNFLTYEFQLIVADIMKRDMDNMTEILSDTLQIMNDIVSMFRLSYTPENGNYNEDYFVDEAITMIPFIEKYDDLLCGYSATIRIKTRVSLDRCVAAFNEFEPDPVCCDEIITQYVKGEILQNQVVIRGSLWNDPQFTSPAEAICQYDALFSFTGSMGTIVVNQVEKFDQGEHNDVYNASSQLQQGEVLVAVEIVSVIPQCPCIEIVLPNEPNGEITQE